jgi:heat shock protein HtpX
MVGRRDDGAVLDPGVGRRRRLRNAVQELLLLTGLVGALGVVAWLLLGVVGLVTVLTTGLVLSALRPRVPVSWVLWMYQARPLPSWAAPQLHWILQVLAERAGLHQPPTLYYVATHVANAFVVGGRDDAALAVSDGLLRVLSAREVAGVLAHEVSHLRNGDTSIMSLSDLVARLAQWMAWFGLWSVLVTLPVSVTGGGSLPLLLSLLLIVVPTFVTLLQLALSRSREYDADLDAASLTGDPEGMARALSVLESTEGRIWERIMVGRSRRPDPLLLQTHPRTEQRVHRLRALEVSAQVRTLDTGHHPAPAGYPLVAHRPRLRRTGIRW